MKQSHNPAHGTGDAKILVVEDEPTIRMLITESLSDLGHACLEAADGPQALAILESSAAINLLIADVGLPGALDGRQVAEAARRLRQDLRVLFVTGYVENAAFNDGHVESGTEVLTKPFMVSELVRRVSRLLTEVS